MDLEHNTSEKPEIKKFGVIPEICGAIACAAIIAYMFAYAL